jgi:hypothetical protein
MIPTLQYRFLIRIVLIVLFGKIAPRNIRIIIVLVNLLAEND